MPPYTGAGTGIHGGAIKPIRKGIGASTTLHNHIETNPCSTDEADDIGMMHHLADADRVMSEARAYALDMVANDGRQR